MINFFKKKYKCNYSLTASERMVFDLLQKRGRKGVSMEHFGKKGLYNFALRSRISDLRAKGLNIITHMEDVGHSKRARYTLHAR